MPPADQRAPVASSLDAVIRDLCRVLRRMQLLGDRVASDLKIDVQINEEMTRQAVHHLIRHAERADPGSSSVTDNLTAISALWAEEASGAPQIEDRLPQQPPELVRGIVARMAAEVVDNVRRHAQATNLKISLDQRSDGIFVQIVDDGVGFDVAARSALGSEQVGLVLLQEHAVAAGGFCKVFSERGHGTTVVYWIPFSEGWRSPDPRPGRPSTQGRSR